MTTTAHQLDPTPALRPYPVDHEWQRGAKLYVARVTIDKAGHVDRAFLRGSAVKTRGTVEYGPKTLGGDLPAWLTRRPNEPCDHCDQPRPIRQTGEELIAAYAAGWEMIGRVFPGDLADILAAGQPGDPDAWTGQTCEECHVTPILGDTGPTCAECQTATAARAHLAALPDTEVF